MQYGNPGQTPSWIAPQGPREGLRRYVQVIRSHWLLIAACVVVATIAAGIYTRVAPRTYQAESQMLITPVNAETDLIGLSLLTNTANPTGDVATAASFITTPEVAALAAAEVGHITPGAALGKVSAAPVASSNVIAITATASTPAQAKALADAFALGTAKYRTQVLHKEIEAILPALQARANALPPAERTGAGSIGERIASLETLLAEPNPTISVQSLAALPTAPSSPKTKLSLLAGVLVGLLLGFGAALAIEGFDPRVRTEERLRAILRLPVLARIPREKMSGHRLSSWPNDLSPMAFESFRMLRVALGTDSAASKSHSLMVTGSTSSEGKSTVALNLAATLASAGTRVILVEADLRRPSLAVALGLPSRRRSAAADGSLEDSLITVEGLEGNLRVLLAENTGAYQANGLFKSTDVLLEGTLQLADYVIFDAPPVAEASDVLSLSREVDDVLIVARLGRTRIDHILDMAEILTREGVLAGRHGDRR